MTANSKLSDFRLQSSDGKNKRSVLDLTLISLLRPIRRSCTGFTLIELMVAMAIIAILGSVGLVMFSSAQKAGRISKRAQDLEALKTGLELYKTATGYYPSGAAANTFACVSTLAATLTPTYMPVIPADPLDGGNTAGTNCYRYASNATTNSTDYKLITRPSIATGGSSAEMSSAQFLRQPTLIDPDRDGGVDDNCDVDTGGTVTGWAIHSGNAAMCNLDAS